MGKLCRSNVLCFSAPFHLHLSDAFLLLCHVEISTHNLVICSSDHLCSAIYIYVSSHNSYTPFYLITCIDRYGYYVLYLMMTSIIYAK